MSQTIVVEAVSDKFKNKYSSGSVLAGGKWLQVSSKVPLNLFQKDSQISVDTVTNDKGYTSIVGVSAAVEEVKVEKKPKTKKEGGQITEPMVSSYEDNKNRRILVQGITQAVAQSPATINFGNEVSEVVAKIKEMALELIEFVDEETH